MAYELACEEAAQRGAAGEIVCTLSEEVTNVGEKTFIMPIKWTVHAVAQLA